MEAARTRLMEGVLYAKLQASSTPWPHERYPLVALKLKYFPRKKTASTLKLVFSASGIFIPEVEEFLIKNGHTFLALGIERFEEPYYARSDRYALETVHFPMQTEPLQLRDALGAKVLLTQITGTLCSLGAPPVEVWTHVGKPEVLLDGRWVPTVVPPGRMLAFT